ncbi:ROK family protein [Microbispora sp. NBRC 16548]|uniref:ROK family protein n=1 Tax=Microbispora sp. NBRC 16548 TaxID=3030994 RepID=UPI0024A2C6BC|nr:ROK family protein [Microbispora sp. NBRC 16548]GLX11610.1 kanosamine kinase [Microbispora sp. NBRC 16548]
MTRLGIDVGGTKVAFRLTGAGLPPREARLRWPSPPDPVADLAALTGEVTRLRAAWGRPITAVGVAMPAALDTGGRVTTWPGRPAWAGLDLGARLCELFPGAAVRWADDGDLAALAEAGRARSPNVVYLGVGTGVGGGVVLDGRPVPGCEIGHLIVDRRARDERCDCGRRGCLQAAASGPATLRRAARLRGEPVLYADLREGLRAGARWAVESLDDTWDALAAAVTGLGELFHPEVAVIGGGFAAGLPGFTRAVARRTVRLARRGFPPVPVRRARLGGLSSLHGAVLLAEREETGAGPPAREFQARSDHD